MRDAESAVAHATNAQQTADTLSTRTSITARFDGVPLTKDQLRVEPAVIDELAAQVDDGLIAAMREAIANIRHYHQHQLGKDWEIERANGVRLGQRVRRTTRRSQEALQQLSHISVEAFTGQRIVKAFGKQDLAGAEEVWNQVIQMAPQSPEGQSAKRALDSLKSAHPGGAAKSGA